MDPSPHILVVDDHRDIRELLGRYLAQHGFRVSPADSAAAARRVLKSAAVDLVVHQTRFKDGTRRITHLTEVERMEGDVITLQDIFLFDTSAGFDAGGRTLGTLRATGLRPSFLEKMQHANVTVDPMLFHSDRI